MQQSYSQLEMSYEVDTTHIPTHKAVHRPLIWLLCSMDLRLRAELHDAAGLENSAMYGLIRSLIRCWPLRQNNFERLLKVKKRKENLLFMGD
jgi:hypothetical protein